MCTSLSVVSIFLEPVYLPRFSLSISLSINVSTSIYVHSVCVFFLSVFSAQVQYRAFLAGLACFFASRGAFHVHSALLSLSLTHLCTLALRT